MVLVIVEEKQRRCVRYQRRAHCISTYDDVETPDQKHRGKSADEVNNGKIIQAKAWLIRYSLSKFTPGDYQKSCSSRRESTVRMYSHQMKLGF